MEGVGRAHLGKEAGELGFLASDGGQSHPATVVLADADEELVVSRKVDTHLVVATADDLIAKGQLALDERELFLGTVLLRTNPIDVDGILQVESAVCLADIVADVVAIGAAFETKEAGLRFCGERAEGSHNQEGEKEEQTTHREEKLKAE